MPCAVPSACHDPRWNGGRQFKPGGRGATLRLLVADLLGGPLLREGLLEIGRQFDLLAAALNRLPGAQVPQKVR